MDLLNTFLYESNGILLHHSINEQPRDADFPMHAHHRCELFCFLSGDGYFSIEGQNYPLYPGYILLMRAGEAHKLHIRPDEPYDRFVVHFPASYLTEADLPSLRARYDNRHLGQNNLLIPPNETLRFLDDCMQRICATGVDVPGRDVRIETYLRTIFLELEEVISRRPEELNALPAAMPGETGDTALIGEMIAYINEHLLELRGLDELEDVFFFSSSYLNRIFRKSTGSSIWDYVILKRLLCARALLRNGKSVTLAASESGFSDYSSFFRQYKNRFGVTPVSDRRHAAPETSASSVPTRASEE